MRSSIDKYKALKKIEDSLYKIEELRNIDQSTDEFEEWKKNLNNLIEDIFSKDSRQFREFSKIKFSPSFMFLGDSKNEQYYQDAFHEGLDSAQFYLNELIVYLKDLWNISVDHENIIAIQPIIQDVEFERLAKSIRENIGNNEPEISLDHLHTFLVKYFRQLCTKYDLVYSKETPLHSLLGLYTKYLSHEKKVESEMALSILKYSISILDKYNDIRNNKSFAHDNKLLGYHESKLIFNNISNLIQYINSIETE